MKIIHLGREYFIQLEKHVNQENYLKYSRVNKVNPLLIKKLNDENHKEIRKELIKNGFLLIDLSHIDTFSLEELASWQEKILGDIIKIKNPKHLPYCKVEATQNSKYFVNSSYSQPLHTDEGYTNSYPQYVSLFCERAAKNGGVSTLVDFFHLYPKLVLEFNSYLKELATPEAITVNNISRVESKPILLASRNYDNSRISYCATLKEMYCSETVFTVFDYITKYIHEPHNQIRFKLTEKQLLIMDNSRVLHGRTAFNIKEPRALYRFWFSLRSCT